ncbi:hypothetical protein I6A60_35270 [Frankia sp. AgB1.9]|uniref:hypothetical protein n=1 Tax=unclassified Frankia TaxID=2632575 RepID=UPI00193296B0|nr:MULTISPECIES: hypothetical protein [unclassified Frankia]MBL7491291.1 hypothetical protein [Frankia sp. AgW1.1]MBL7553073.1 hypothetical protein [Frankia sp. AgB1.9]MBL7623670.1 hypothetical protein [Frankia sp. AgB1.8]
MHWGLVDTAVIVVALLVFAALAVGLWRKVKTVRATAKELSARVSGLSAETAALSARLDSAEVMARVSDRAN